MDEVPHLQRHSPLDSQLHTTNTPIRCHVARAYRGSSTVERGNADGCAFYGSEGNIQIHFMEQGCFPRRMVLLEV